MADPTTPARPAFVEPVKFLRGPGPIATAVQDALAAVVRNQPPDVKAVSLLSVTVKDGQPTLSAAFGMRERKGWTIGAYGVVPLKDPTDLEAGVFIQRVWR